MSWIPSLLEYVAPDQNIVTKEHWEAVFRQIIAANNSVHNQVELLSDQLDAAVEVAVADYLASSFVYDHVNLDNRWTGTGTPELKSTYAHDVNSIYDEIRAQPLNTTIEALINAIGSGDVSHSSLVNRLVEATGATAETCNHIAEAIWVVVESNNLEAVLTDILDRLDTAESAISSLQSFRTAENGTPDVYSGTAEPSSALGKTGDVYIKHG